MTGESRGKITGLIKEEGEMSQSVFLSLERIKMHRNDTLVILVFSMILLSRLPKAQAYEIKGTEITPLAGIEETYDDNIAFTKAGKEDDFFTTLSAGITADYKDKLKSWGINANVHRQIFAQKRSFNNTSEDVTVIFSEELTKYQRVNLKNAFTHTYEPASFQESFGRTSGRYSYYMNQFHLEYARELSKQRTFSAAYSNEINEFRRAGQDDSFENSLSAQLDMDLNSTSDVLLLYKFSARDFNSGGNAFQNTLAAGFKQYLTKQLSYNAQAGIDFISSYSDKNYIRPLFSFALTDEIDDKTSVGLEFLKETSKNPYIADIFDSRKAGLSLTRQLSEKSSFTISGFYGQGKYPESAISDRLAGAEASYTYELSKRTELNLSYLYSKIGSTDESREYKKNGLSLGLRAEF